MKGTMKALRMYAPYDFRIDEVAIPEIGDDDILIRVKGCGVCSGDVKTYHGGQRVWGTSPETAYIEAPCIGGHEFHGVVAEKGKNVTKVEIGDRILAEQILPCGECKFCRQGNYWMCQPHRIFGFKHEAEGGFADIKGDSGFTRFLCKGTENVFAEYILYAMAHNLGWLHSRIQNDKLDLHLYELKEGEKEAA